MSLKATLALQVSVATLGSNRVFAAASMKGYNGPEVAGEDLCYKTNKAARKISTFLLLTLVAFSLRNTNRRDTAHHDLTGSTGRPLSSILTSSGVSG